MASRDKKKNPAGFSEDQLRLLLNYCWIIRQKPKMPISKIHKKCSFYSRTKSTSDTINKAYRKKVVTGPFLFVNSGIEISLIRDIDNPREFFEKCKNDSKTTFAVVSHGHWPIFLCKHGANTLQYHDSILPSNGEIGDKVAKIFLEEKGRLQEDLYPHGWSDWHWKIFYCMDSSRSITFREAGEKLGLSWVRVREYFVEVLKQCKVMTNFFPLGTEAYSPLLVTLKTDYEIGLVKGLRTLNRTTYLYKTNNTIILFLCIGPSPRAHNHFTDKFQKLEEVGSINDLHISTPYDWFKF